MIMNYQSLHPGAISPNTAPPTWLLVTGGETLSEVGGIPAAWWERGARDALLVRVDASDAHRFDDSARAAVEACQRSGRSEFLFLIERCKGRDDGVTYGPAVHSFVCALSLMEQLLRQRTLGKEIPYVDTRWPDRVDVSAYDAGIFALDHARPIPPIRCLQIPAPNPIVPESRTAARAEWIIPHRGNPAFLDGVLSTMQWVAAEGDRISVGLDEPVADGHLRLIDRYPDYRFFEAHPHGNGPAVAMDKLWRASSADFILFQDSDDVSCVDRRRRLVEEAERRELDIVGCHEVRIDENTRSVQAFLFPAQFDAKTLFPTNQHAVSIPLSAIRRSILKKSGGFSSVLRFGHDTEFLYRAVIAGARIGNVDDYMFVRRKHAKSMTANPETGHNSAARKQVLEQWGQDFGAWMAQRTPVERLSFVLKHRPDYKSISMHPLV